MNKPQKESTMKKHTSTKGKQKPRQEPLPLPPTGQWYTSTRDTAKLLGVCYLTLNRYRKKGVIPEPDIVLSQRRKGYSQEALMKITRTVTYSMNKKRQNDDEQIGDYKQMPLEIEAHR
jgi:hypothetical protein